MKNTYFRLPILLITVLSVILSACGLNNNKPIASFSEASWDYCVDDMIALEGNTDKTYKSIYGGMTYSYPKQYNGYNGTIKYMFDGNNKLMCIAWAYGCDDQNELYALYDEINEAVIKTHGESNYNANGHSSNYGNVWHLETGDIIISTMITEDNKALQYAYLNPIVSNTETQTESK